MTRKAKFNNISVSKSLLENLLWTSYRYCIGRTTYTTQYAYDIARELCDVFDDEKRKEFARDILHEIEYCMHVKGVPFFIHDYSTDKNQIDALALYIDYMNSQTELTNYNDTKLIKRINCDVYYDNNITYNVERHANDTNGFIKIDMFMDLLPWHDLACVLDTRKHYVIKTKNNQCVECIKSYICEVRGTDIGNTIIPFKYREVYKPIDCLDNSSYIQEQMIMNIEQGVIADDE